MDFSLSLTNVGDFLGDSGVLDDFSDPITYGQSTIFFVWMKSTKLSFTKLG